MHVASAGLAFLLPLRARAAVAGMRAPATARATTIKTLKTT